MLMIGAARLRVVLAGQDGEALNLDICRMGHGMVDNTPFTRQQARTVSELCGFTFRADPDAGPLVLMICQLPAYEDADKV